MQQIVVSPPSTVDLRAVLSEYLEDHAEMNQHEREDRLIMALTDTFASRVEIEKMKAELLANLRESLDHLKDGNGAPGLHSMDKTLTKHDDDIKALKAAGDKWQWLRRHVVTASISVVLAIGVGWLMSRATAAPIAKETAVDQQKIDALEQKIDKLLNQQQPVVAPAVEPAEQRRVRRPAPMPKGRSQVLPDGARIVDDGLLKLSSFPGDAFPGRDPDEFVQWP